MIDLADCIPTTWSTWPTACRPHDRPNRLHTDHTWSTQPTVYRPHMINPTDCIPTTHDRPNRLHTDHTWSTQPTAYRPHDRSNRLHTDHMIDPTDCIPTTHYRTNRPHDRPNRRTCSWNLKKCRNIVKHVFNWTIWLSILLSFPCFAYSSLKTNENIEAMKTIPSDKILIETGIVLRGSCYVLHMMYKIVPRMMLLILSHVWCNSS